MPLKTELFLIVYFYFDYRGIFNQLNISEHVSFFFYIYPQTKYLQNDRFTTRFFLKKLLDKLRIYKMEQRDFLVQSSPTFPAFVDQGVGEVYASKHAYTAPCA